MANQSARSHKNHLEVATATVHWLGFRLNQDFDRNRNSFFKWEPEPGIGCQFLIRILAKSYHWPNSQYIITSPDRKQNRRIRTVNYDDEKSADIGEAPFDEHVGWEKREKQAHTESEKYAEKVKGDEEDEWFDQFSVLFAHV